ncbi:hypothetical protein DMB92_05640 [Campylobacter sp. MIT 99-7217]|uniref:SH3 domain-containing C40 family peptidase n=1 Tax=Campylobacter sp. MIT 99-7217 TaxID=535091 RepID=UPI00115B86BE|nr:SH3 domain-containing C40 family peptidase [Campylobacter sp. MIT 99-7217]TQR31869.1 hypothetical protein DMB92_05640 [Campylobacter sp. MIT 99-7217]
MRFKILNFAFFLNFFVFFMIACSTKTTTKTPITQNNTYSPQEQGQEEYFVDPYTYKDKSFVDLLDQFRGFDVDMKAQYHHYMSTFFDPWNDHLRRRKFDINKIFWAFGGYLNPNKEYYFFSKIPIPKSFFEKALDNANKKAFLSVSKKALLIRNSFSKNIPVNTEILLDPLQAGEGVPFDYAMDSALNAGTPVFISHYTKDKQFALVYSFLGWGFVRADDLELFNEKRVQIYKKLQFITPLYEKKPILSIEGKFLFETRIGAIYPFYKSDAHFYYGKIGKNSYKIPKNEASSFPLQANDANLKRMMKELVGLPYGWGGYGFERDCSLLTRDIFGSFGVFLPRNSYAQALSFTNLDISTLNNEQKLKFIAKYAKAYQSLLYLKGHITLYVGKVEDKELMFHSIWGLRSKENGRLLIGSSAFTPLDVGSEDKRVKQADLILSRMSMLSIFGLSEAEKKTLQEELLKLAH